LISDIQVPFVIQRHYRIPRFANKKTLVICSSYSGNTEETLSAYEDALVAGARVIAISTGGKLAIKAITNKMPFVSVPEGFPPRAAIGYSFATLYCILSRLGICEYANDEIAAAAGSMRDQLYKYHPDYGENPALSLAGKIKDRIPVIFGGQDSLDAVAARFKGQLCENAKMLAFANQFPESNHNEICGWDGLKGDGNRLVAIMLKDIEDHKRIRKRFEIVSTYFRDKGIDTIELCTVEAPRITRMFLMIQLIDFCSYYLALLNGVDPYIIKAIDFLKERLSEQD